MLPLLVRPPMVATGAGTRDVPVTAGLAASPGVASGPIATHPDAAQRSAEAGTAGDPRARRDLARRRPRHGQGGGHPDVPWRPRQPCGRRGPRLGHPGGRRRGGLEVGDGRVTIGERSWSAVRSSRSMAARARCSRAPSPGRPRFEVATLLDWARASWGSRSRRMPTRPSGRARQPPRRPRATPDRASVAVAIKGFAAAEAVADAVLASAEDVRPIVERFVTDGLVAPTVGAFRLTDVGHIRAERLLAAERDGWGITAERGAGGIPRTRRADEGRIVTAWQMRDDDTIRSSTTTPMPPTTRTSSIASRRSTTRRGPGSRRSGPAVRASPTTASG